MKKNKTINFDKGPKADINVPAFGPFKTWKALQWCGCGDVGKALGQLRDVLGLYRDSANTPKTLEWLEQAPNLALVYFLDGAKLLEHGGSVYGSWLSPEGKAFLAQLEEQGCEPDLWEINGMTYDDYFQECW